MACFNQLNHNSRKSDAEQHFSEHLYLVNACILSFSSHHIENVFCLRYWVIGSLTFFIVHFAYKKNNNYTLCILSVRYLLLLNLAKIFMQECASCF